MRNIEMKNPLAPEVMAVVRSAFDGYTGPEQAVVASSPVAAKTLHVRAKGEVETVEELAYAH